VLRATERAKGGRSTAYIGKDPTVCDEGARNGQVAAGQPGCTSKIGVTPRNPA
jgi:hypothetical protein